MARSGFESVTLALAMAAPLLSVTVPRIEVVEDCAQALDRRRRNIETNQKNFGIRIQAPEIF